MFSKRNKSSSYLNSILYILVVLLFLGLFRFIFNCINIVSETNQNNFSYIVKTRQALCEIDKIIESAENNLNLYSEYIFLNYDTSKLYNFSYNSEFLKQINTMTYASLVNSPGVNGVWFQLNAEVPFSVVMYSWYMRKNNKYIDLNKQLDNTDSSDRKITPKDDPYYFNAVNNKKTTWSNIYTDVDLNLPMMTISKPIYKNKKLVGVAGIDLSVKNLERALRNTQAVFKGSDVFLLNQEGAIVLYKLNEENIFTKNRYNFISLFELNKNKNINMTEYTEYGIRKTAILFSMPNLYHIVITFPNNIIYKGFNQLFKTIYLIFFLLIALVVMTIFNIKQIKKISKEVDDRARKLEIIFDSSPNIIVLKDVNDRYKTCNSKFTSFLNISRNNLIGKTTSEVFNAEQAEQIIKMENIVKKTKKMLSYEACYQGLEGDIFLRKYIIPLFDSQNELVEILIIAFDITKNKVEQKILKQAKEAAEKNTAMKNNFLANMSHEIRTPLNGIVGFIQLLKDTNLSKEQAEFIEDAQKSSEILLDIINDILDFSKIEAGKLQVENISFDIRALVEDITLFSSATAEIKNLEVSSLICSDVPERVFGDPGRVRQILNNLISNAIKFTHKGEIVIYVKQILEDSETSFVSFEVKDTGIGIEEDKLNLIFEEFAQSDASMTRKYGGTGLGLAISQKLVTLMNGVLHVKSKLGEGSTFTFNLPFVKDKTSSAEACKNIRNLSGIKILVIDDNQTDLKIIRHYLSEANCIIYEAKTCNEAVEIIKNEKNNISMILIDYKMQINCDSEFCELDSGIGIFNDIPVVLYTSLAKRGDSIWAKEKGFRGYLTKPIKKDDLIETINMVVNDKEYLTKNQFITKHVIKETKFLSQSKILVVEDSDLNCKLINKIFESHGIYCDFAYNGYEAIDAFKSKKYDLILMDCQMPIVDGYKATAEIRKLENKESHIPIIAMTANALPTDRDKCLSIGMDDYISKPININLLMEMISKYISFGPHNNETMTNNEINDGINQVNTYINRVTDELMFSRKDAIDLIIEYLNFLPSSIVELERAFENNDIENIKFITHKIKSSSLNLRMDRISDISIELEKAINEEKSLDELILYVNKIRNCLIDLNDLFLNYTDKINSN